MADIVMAYLVMAFGDGRYRDEYHIVVAYGCTGVPAVLLPLRLHGAAGPVPRLLQDLEGMPCAPGRE